MEKKQIEISQDFGITKVFNYPQIMVAKTHTYYFETLNNKIRQNRSQPLLKSMVLCGGLKLNETGKLDTIIFNELE